MHVFVLMWEGYHVRRLYSIHLYWYRSVMLVLVLVLVLKDSLRTKMKSLSLSWSLRKSPGPGPGPWHSSPCPCPCPGPWRKVLVKVLAVQFFTPVKQLADYIQRINSPEFNPTELPMTAVWQQYPLLHSLLSKTFCTPASSAPVERVFSQSDLILRPHRAKMNDTLLETLSIRFVIKCETRPCPCPCP